MLCGYFAFVCSFHKEYLIRGEHFCLQKHLVQYPPRLPRVTAICQIDPNLASSLTHTVDSVVLSKL